ncbi:MAG: FHA domain-containing protein [Prevotellaceae bacterium]|jgi:hypothetical protein|nr:FHA domain-containing protein [Prevotellaceae bacterium]
MKIITIGRAPENTVVTGDPLAANYHLRIIQDNDGRFRLVNCDINNDTFVNEVKVLQEVHLNENDVIRIGNTVLPWETYFSKAKTVTVAKPPKPKPKPKLNRGILWGIIGSVVAVALAYFILFGKSTEFEEYKQRAKINYENEVYEVALEYCNNALAIKDDEELKELRQKIMMEIGN